MKLFYSPTSPFVRKVMVCAMELGLDQRIERRPGKAHPIDRDQTIIPENPLGQVPSFVADDGTVLYDSRVVCEYLDSVAGGGRLFPAPGAARWRALVDQSLADGLLDAALLARYETAVRPESAQYPAWRAGQLDKIRCALDSMQKAASGYGSRVDIGTITIGCALGYLDFRFPELHWREGHGALAAWYETFAQRPSMVATQPPG